jgi:succinoglycan biosynthesis transport protein ExoP
MLGISFNSVFGRLWSEQADSEAELNRRAVLAFQDRLTIKRLGLSYVIQIGFESYDAARAAQIANEVADAYITDQLDAKYQATKRASVWLEDRIKELRDQVSVAETAVVDFKTKNNIVTTGGSNNRLVGEQQVSELNSQLVLAGAAKAEASARLDRIKTVLSAGSSDATVDGTVADTLHNDLVTKLRGQYLEIAAREADWSARYGHDHLAAVNLRNQMAEIRNSIYEELQRLGETYKSDYAIAKQREDSIRSELAQAVTESQTTDAAQIPLRELESNAQTYKTLYNNFLQRYTEAIQQQSFPITEARLISSASQPIHKSHPRTLLVLVAAGFGGMIIGFGVALFRDLSDRVFRTSEQLESLLEVNCIAIVPYMTAAEADEQSGSSSEVLLAPGNPMTDAGQQNERRAGAHSLLRRSSKAFRSLPLVSDLHGSIKSTKSRIDAFTSTLADESKPLGALSLPGITPGSTSLKKIVRTDDTFWPVIDAPLSRFTEAIRSIKLATDLNGVVKSSQVIGLTSSLPNEGKSTIAVALAQLMSQVGKRTILVDCDLRNPTTSRALAPDAKAGLLEVIVGKASLKEVIWSDPITNLVFLPVAGRRRLAHSNEILSSAATKKIFEELRESYDYVVVDMPPLAPIVDVRAAAHLVDSFIYIVEWGRTRIDVVEHALGHAPDVYENLLGVVLNKVDMNVFGRFINSQESYYYNKHYERYGYSN